MLARGAVRLPPGRKDDSMGGAVRLPPARKDDIMGGALYQRQGC